MQVFNVKDRILTWKRKTWAFANLKAASLWRISIYNIPYESIKPINIFGLKQITDTSRQLEKAKIYYANWMYLAWTLCNFYINKWLEGSLQRPMWLAEKLHKFTYCLMKYMLFFLRVITSCVLAIYQSSDCNDDFCSRISYNTLTF